MRRLAFYHRTDTGEWQATIDGYYHAIGISKDQAVRRLEGFLRRAHPEVWHDCSGLIRDYFRPIQDQNMNGTATTAQTVNSTVNSENALDDESEKT